MDCTTNVVLCFGYQLNEDEQKTFPWDGYQNFGAWYYSQVLSYQPLFNLQERKEFTEEEIQQYVDHANTFCKENPLPCEAIAYCLTPFPMWILAAHVYTANYRYPHQISSLNTNKDDVDKLTNFCLEYKLISPDSVPEWHLCTYEYKEETH